jgi:hypothetical protein
LQIIQKYKFWRVEIWNPKQKIKFSFCLQPQVNWKAALEHAKSIYRAFIQKCGFQFTENQNQNSKCWCLNVGEYRKFIYRKAIVIKLIKIFPPCFQFHWMRNFLNWKIIYMNEQSPSNFILHKTVQHTHTMNGEFFISKNEHFQMQMRGNFFFAPKPKFKCNDDDDRKRVGNWYSSVAFL